MLLSLQRNRRGEEQDQDVCSAESHTAQRTTQGHHPGRGRQVREGISEEQRLSSECGTVTDSRL